ncbi:MAG: hypothetical protein K5662_05530 [Lachnospiraceae bacterium]|nr:hypothetical protein [Lachnospiraceae bacterium]
MDVRKERALLNKKAIILFTVMTVVLFAAYLVQYLQGEKTSTVFLIMALTDLIPMIVSWVIYKTRCDADILRHVIAIGYGIFYAVSCYLNSDYVMVFVYAIPMVFVVGLYNDYKFSIRIGLGVGIIGITHGIMFAYKSGFTKEALTNLEIEVALLLLVIVFSAEVVKTTAKLNDQKVASINESAERTRGMLDKIIEVSDTLVGEIANVSDKMSNLSASSQETLAVMEEVQIGTNESANSVQNQLVKTEEIQNQIDKVENVSGDIGSNIDLAVEAVREGRDNITKLIENAKASEEAGNHVITEVEELKASTVQMESIISLIGSIAAQTSLLSLNASIEAARAGEAGRGFAVVANEVSTLADQTQSATTKIKNLIEGISSEIDGVVDAIHVLVDSNKVQNESANITSGSFVKIVDSTRGIRSNSEELAVIVAKLAEANREIGDSIQTISAVSEQVLAHTTETCKIAKLNSETVEDVQSYVDIISDNASVLKELTEA